MDDEERARVARAYFAAMSDLELGRSIKHALLSYDDEAIGRHIRERFDMMSDAELLDCIERDRELKQLQAMLRPQAQA